MRTCLNHAMNNHTNLHTTLGQLHREHKLVFPDWGAAFCAAEYMMLADAEKFEFEDELSAVYSRLEDGFEKILAKHF